MESDVPEFEPRQIVSYSLCDFDKSHNLSVLPFLKQNKALLPGSLWTLEMPQFLRECGQRFQWRGSQGRCGPDQLPSCLSVELTYRRCHFFTRSVSPRERPGTAVERDFASGVPTAKPVLGRAESSAPPAAGSGRGPGQVPAPEAQRRSPPGSHVRHRVV